MPIQDHVDIQPTPNVLLALTRTPISPIDALCELVDNALDSFRAAEIEGIKLASRQVFIEVPGISEVQRNEGVLRVRDTGPGLTQERIADALRAGFSTKNAFDTLGLFGMGFNIASGKLGRTTRLISARPELDDALQVTLDLPSLLESGQFSVPCEAVAKPSGFTHGTIVEIRGWWPSGDPNSGFIKRLAQMSKPVIREQLARRYATLLRTTGEESVRISVNGESDVPFEHCVWGTERFVERSGRQIFAVERFNKTLDESLRCPNDGSVVDGSAPCERCGSTDTRSVQHRVSGWVGVQRFDDQNEFGIDLIRNGRAIRIGEKSAFFEHVDEDTKKAEKEYPIDQQYGRIVGEIHLDHVPVDFSKQDFQRTSDEWHAAMAFIRGDSLLPSKWGENHVNDSPVSTIFQGFRKVRNFGRGDLYMGIFNPLKGKADRIGRDIERDLYKRFLAREVGYYDDQKWFEYVETANERPLEHLNECATCGFQNLADAETCGACGMIFKPKECLNPACNEVMALSAVICEACGSSQIPELVTPWTCKFCKTQNNQSDESCITCGRLYGSPHPASTEALAPESMPHELTLKAFTLTLTNGVSTSPIDVDVRVVSRPILMAPDHSSRVPLASFRAIGSIQIFIDPTHAAFVDLRLRMEDCVAMEVASSIYNIHTELVGSPGYSITKLCTDILAKAWSDTLSESVESVATEIRKLFQLAGERAQALAQAADFYTELTEEQQGQLATSLISSGVNLSELNRMRATGEYLKYVDPMTLVTFFRAYPGPWFSGTVWSETWPDDDLGVVVAGKIRAELTTKYLRCLEDCASYLDYATPEPLLTTRAQAAVEFLASKLQ